MRLAARAARQARSSLVKQETHEMGCGTLLYFCSGKHATVPWDLLVLWISLSGNLVTCDETSECRGNVAKRFAFFCCCICPPYICTYKL